MKLGNKISLIAGLGCVALVGSGFAAWTFAQSANQTEAIGANVAEESKSGDVTISKSGLKITFDQAAVTDGVHTGKAVWSGSLTATYTGDTKESGLVLSYDVTIADSAADYVTFAGGEKKVSSLSWVSGTAITPDSVSALGLVFNQDKAPQNESEYNAFVTAVANLGNIVTFSFDATVAA
jgi:hypothetical protein